MNGFAKGLKLVKQKFNNIDIRFIANLDRTAQVKDNCKYIQELVKYRDMISLIAVGMDMQELGYPAHRQAEALLLQKKMDSLLRVMLVKKLVQKVFGMPSNRYHLIE